MPGLRRRAIPLPRRSCFHSLPSLAVSRAIKSKPHSFFCLWNSSSLALPQLRSVALGAQRYLLTAGSAPSSQGRAPIGTPHEWHQKSELFDSRHSRSMANKVVAMEYVNSLNVRREAEWLTYQYNVLMSRLVKEFRDSTGGGRITAENVPDPVSQLQCWYMESYCAAYLAVHKVCLSLDSIKPGVDHVAFTSRVEVEKRYKMEGLKGTRFAMSGKSRKVKKDLPKSAIITVEKSLRAAKEASEHNTSLKVELINQCNVKNLREGFKCDSVRRSWAHKIGTKSDSVAVYTSTIRDRVLQLIVEATVHPVVEAQADPNSYAYRPKRKPAHAVASVARHLQPLTMVKSQWRRSFVVSKDYPSCTVETDEISRDNQPEVIRSRPDVDKIKYSSNFTIYNKFIRIDIPDCYEELPHQVVLKYYPLCPKYRHLLQAWLQAPVYGPKDPDTEVPSKQNPSKGVARGTALSHSIVNSVLDGLESWIESALPYQSTLDKVECESFRLKTGIFDIPSDKLKYVSKLTVVRYANHLLIFGKSSERYFRDIQQRLSVFLKQRGLEVDEALTQFVDFNPGASFAFLGFHYQFVIPGSKKMMLGKYTNPYRHPNIRTVGTHTPRSNLLVIIQKSYFAETVMKIKHVLALSNTGLPVSSTVRRYNIALREIVNYFGITPTAREQLSYLNHLTYKRFRKLLLRKYGSTPGVKGYIRSIAYTPDKRVRAPNGEIQLRTSDVSPYGNIPLVNLAPCHDVLVRNVYLEPEFWANHEYKLLHGCARHKASREDYLSYQELKILLAYMQKWKCPSCGQPIDKMQFPEGDYTDVEHEPRLYELKAIAWRQILKDLKVTPDMLFAYKNSKGGDRPHSSEYNKLYFKLRDGDKIATQYWDCIQKDAYHILVHRECHEKNVEQIKTDALKVRQAVSEYCTEDLFDAYLKLSKEWSHSFRSTIQLTKRQRKEVLFRSNSYRKDRTVPSFHE